MIKFANNAVSTLTVALFDSDTVVIIDAADAPMFPTPAPGDYFLITIEDSRIVPIQREICKCTERVGNALTVVRAQEGWPAQNFAVGTATVSNRVTAKTMDMSINLLPPADNKVYAQQLATPEGIPNWVEVITSAGSLNIGGPLGVGVTPAAGVVASSISTGDLFINGNLAFNTYWSPTSWKYRSAGAAALITFDPASPMLTFNTAATGAAGATPNFFQALRIDTKGNVAGYNSSLVPANSAWVTWSPPPITFDAAAWLSWNLYIATDSAWRTKASGYSAMVHFDTAGGNLNFYVNPTAGSGAAPALTHVMRLDTTQGLTALGRVYATNGVVFSSSNSWEWVNYTDGSGNHISQHRSGWYDLWQSSGGGRLWVGANVTIMSLDGSGNLVVPGLMRAAGGLWATGDTSYGFYLASSRYAVMQFTADNWRMHFDRSNGVFTYANPSNATLFSIGGGGALYAAGNITTPVDVSCRSIYTSGTVQGSWLHSTGDMQIDGQINGSHNVVIAGDFHGNAVFCPAGLFPSTGYDFGLFPASGTRYLRMGDTWEWRWNSANGDMIWVAGNTNQWIMRRSDNACFNQIGPVGGNGAYWNLSDRRAKTIGEPTTRGLAEIMKLVPHTYTRLPQNVMVAGDDGPVEKPGTPVTEIGFIAQDVITVIPEAVARIGMALPDGSGTFDDPEPTMAMTYDTITAVMVNAIKELAARVAALEGARA